MERKKIIIIVGVLVLLAIIVYFVYREFILRPMIEEQVKNMLGNYKMPSIEPPSFPE